MTLSACSSKEYEAHIQSGTESVKDEKYEDALLSFQKAAEEKNTDDVQQFITFAKYMTDSLDLFEKGEFSAAILTSEKITKTKKTDKVIDLLKPKALKLQEEAAGLDEQFKRYTDDLTKSQLLLEQQQFDEAYNLCKAITENGSPHPKFDQLVKEANERMAAALEQKNAYLAEAAAKEKAEAEKKHQEELAKEAAKTSTEQIFSFLREARTKQLNMNGSYPSKAAVQEELSPYLTWECSSYFFDKMFWQQNGMWEIKPTDYLVGYVPNFSYSSETKVEQNGSNFIVSEWIPAENEGPTTWDAHTISATVVKTGDSMVISNISE